jgi:hypothetical protein
MLPKFMSNGSEKNSSGSGNTPRVTPRTKNNYGYNRRNPYAQFDDGRHETTDVEMTRWEEQEGYRPDIKNGASHTVIIGGQTRATASDDDNSERGIVETKSVVIERS